MVEFILYIADQKRSAEFYKALLKQEPVLDVPGMTEFELQTCCKLGLMPETGIARILNDETPHPSKGNGIPRCELYLKVQNAAEYMERGVALGAKLVSPLQNRAWGDAVGYLMDMDGHIIAFVEKAET